MSRAERLLSLIQFLRRHRKPVTAAAIAAELRVSVRTVYRDIGALQGTGAPVRGEAGIGYVLEAGYELPPLMFDEDEIEAIVLGLRLVERRGDGAIAAAARNVAAKVGSVLPPRLRPVLLDAALIVPPPLCAVPDRIDVARLREAIRAGRKVDIDYRDEEERESRRTVWPLALSFMAETRLLVGWCELRGAFRHFRVDRIAGLEMRAESYPGRRQALLRQWQDETRRTSGRPGLDLLA